MHVQLKRHLVVGALAAGLLLGHQGPARAEAGQRVFKQPQDAAVALLNAVQISDKATLTALFGSDGKALLTSGDAVEDKNARKTFLHMWGEKCNVVPLDRNRYGLMLGKDGWFFPIPLVKTRDGWHFDTKAGKEEILNRRIGTNELHTIAACHAYVDAQREYASKNPGGGAYAQKFISSEGQKDGLYWPAAKGETLSPLGPVFTQASTEGYAPGQNNGGAFHGYRFKILTSQDQSAPGGAKNYLVDGKMTGGFGLVAWPVTYKNSGVMTFVVNQSGIVFEKNLGKDTEETATAITSVDPDQSWRPVRLP